MREGWHAQAGPRMRSSGRAMMNDAPDGMGNGCREHWSRAWTGACHYNERLRPDRNVPFRAMRRLMILWAEDRDCRLLGARINRPRRHRANLSDESAAPYHCYDRRSRPAAYWPPRRRLAQGLHDLRVYCAAGSCAGTGMGKPRLMPLASAQPLPPATLTCKKQ